MESTNINDDCALPWILVIWDAWLATGPTRSRDKVSSKRNEDGIEESSLRSGTNARYRHESERLVQHVSIRSLFNQHGRHNADVSLTVNNIRTSAIACRILSSAIDRCCKHAMLVLEATVMMMPVMLLPDLVPLTSRTALLVVLVLLPSREHRQYADNQAW